MVATPTLKSGLLKFRGLPSVHQVFIAQEVNMVKLCFAAIPPSTHRISRFLNSPHTLSKALNTHLPIAGAEVSIDG